MPGFDGTGPLGYGPLSGRRGGYCRGSIALRRAFYGAGPIRRGSGMGGFGRGYRWQYLETGLPRWARTLETDEPFRTGDTAALLTALERTAKALEEELNDVKARLESLKVENREESEEANVDPTLDRSQ
jgi:Family of unknown function (DUF5320)